MLRTSSYGVRCVIQIHCSCSVHSRRQNDQNKFNIAFFSSSPTSSLLVSIYGRWLKHISLVAFFLASFYAFFPLKAVFVVLLLQKDTLVRRSLRFLYCWARVHLHPLYCYAPIIGSPGQLGPVKDWESDAMQFFTKGNSTLHWLIMSLSPCFRSWLPKCSCPTAPIKLTFSSVKDRCYFCRLGFSITFTCSVASSKLSIYRAIFLPILCPPPHNFP